MVSWETLEKIAAEAGISDYDVIDVDPDADPLGRGVSSGVMKPRRKTASRGCEGCGASGKIGCPKCGGSGVWEGEYASGECRLCSGSGQVDHFFCCGRGGWGAEYGHENHVKGSRC